MKQVNFIIMLLLLSISGAHAACSSPVGPIGSMQYVATDGEFKYCNDSSSWISMSADITTPGAACSTAGMIVGDKYCDGSFFYSMNSQNLDGGACTPSSSYKYFSNSMHLCFGGTWNKTGLCSSCGIALTCADYAGHMAPCVAAGCQWNNLIHACEDVPTTGGPPSDDS